MNEKDFDLDGLYTLESLLEDKIHLQKINLYEEKSRIPGIYFLFDEKKIVYVGQSSDIYERMRWHLRENTKVFDGFSYLTFEKEPTHERVLEEEGKYILKYYPKYNKELPRKATSFIYMGKPFDSSTPNQKVFIPGILLNGKLYIDISPYVEKNQTKTSRNFRKLQRTIDGEVS